ncbi:MAG: tetratricopeptide (TPR) repeat protein [Gammaproteobacteria bacterium]|jgi:tetratricopeptide (TPR) repeat protein
MVSVTGSFRRSAHTRSVPVLLFCVLTVLSTSAWGYSFTLSAREWSSWPAYCKAKYVITSIGQRSQFARQVPASEVKKWEEKLGHTLWPPIHHGCAAMVWINRAERASDSHTREVAIRSTIGESDYTFRYLSRDNFLHAKLSSLVARAHDLRGQKTKAREMIRQLIKTNPEHVDLYTVLSKFYFDDGNFSGAKTLLTNGMEHVAKPSAELHYFLGLVLIRLGEHGAAVVQAKEAMRLGYPLPGLKRNLLASGHWRD